MKKSKKNSEDKSPIITFRCPDWILKQIDERIAQNVMRKSSRVKLFKYTRTDLIIESLVKWNKFKTLDESDKSI